MVNEMTRTYTTPETQPSVTNGRVMSFSVVIGYDESGVASADQTYFEYVVNEYDENGAVSESHRRVVPFSSWPSAVKTDLKAVYQRVLSDAEAQGFLHPGADTDDLP